MNEMKANWDDLRLFAAVARGGGLAKASQTTGKSAPTLSRRMYDLEAVLGRELFRRLPKGYDLTQDGMALLADVAALEARMSGIWRAPAAGKRTLIKISAGTWMTKYLCDHMGDILPADTGVMVRLISAEEVLDINRRQAVIGIRNQRPHQRGLAGRKVGRVRFAAYAAHAGVDTWGCYTGRTPSADWLRAHAGDAPAVEVTHPRNGLDLALAGAARVILPTFIGDAQDGLIRVGKTIADLDSDQWLVMHDDDRFGPEVRQTIDRIHAVLRALHRTSS